MAKHRLQEDRRFLPLFSHNGEVDTGYSLEEWVQKVVEAGAGEILLTSVELDGTMQGYDVEMIKIATELVNVPVIASGGAGSYEDMYQAIMQGGASAVAAASIYHFTEQTPRGGKGISGRAGAYRYESNNDSAGAPK